MPTPSVNVPAVQLKLPPLQSVTGVPWIERFAGSVSTSGATSVNAVRLALPSVMVSVVVSPVKIVVGLKALSIVGDAGCPTPSVAIAGVLVVAGGGLHLPGGQSR